MRNLKRNIIKMGLLGCIISSCNYEREYSYGIETDPDLGKSLKELAKKNPNIIKRNDNIAVDKFTFTHTVFYSAKRDSITLHSIDFNNTNEEKVLFKFSNGELAIGTHAENKVYESTDYNIIIIGNDSIEVEEVYTKKVVFQGIQKRE